jgi:tetratricopeptide (TPR) repeat protein
MPSNFDLIITADTPNHSAEFNLLDESGVQLAFRQTDFKTIELSHKRGLFDLRNYLRHYVVEGQEEASVADIGVCIAEQVLGADIFKHLWASESQRTLRIQLPGATQEENHLAAALARVPWEIARPSADKQTLGERNLLVRVVHLAQEDMAAPVTQPLELKPGESLRVLFVFAEARGSRPLAARKERRELLDLFKKEIYPQRRIEAHFLTHGVTRERLEAQIRENGGYHIVHWSGHGHLNLLELAKAGGSGDHLSGDELLDLFTDAGGFIPRLFFLSACHSGDILRVKDWNDFMAVAQGKEPGTKQATTEETKQIEMEEQPGYTGTAHALLQGGVPSVIAMRYAVGDEYARELSVEFYRALLAHAQPKNAAAALTMARKSLLDPKRATRAHFVVCDHATPVLYGENDPGLALQKGRSPALDTRNPRLHQITELTTAGHEHFVGRTWELADLGAEFIGSSHSAEVKPVAVITGLGGMGKTALVAEALALWESRFEWVLLYQAKPNRLEFDTMLRDIHLKLNAELGRYHEHVKARPADAIYRAADAEFTGQERLERLTRNLIRALKDEAILLVLDNFETNLKPQPEPGASDGEPLWACQDPAWERCLAKLAEELAGAPSRVLITCRRPLAALKPPACQQVLLGPLPAGEAALYLREHAGLSRMFFNADAAERALAMRLLNASRFHPLLMDRLARLATGGAALRGQLMQALDTLEQTKDFAQLPALFATTPGDAKEMAYLNDALATSLDQLIHDASPDARRLLWMIAVANEPVELLLLQSVWSGEDGPQQQQLRQIKQMLEMLPLLPPELQEQLKAISPEERAMLDALPPPALARSDPAPLLRNLIAVGLITEERSGPDDENLALACHELVRERIRAWMQDDNHTQDWADLSENSIRLGYAERLAAVFDALQHQNMAAALQVGSRALVYCGQAGDYGRLGEIASWAVTGTTNPRLIANLLPQLEAAVASAPEGMLRWRCLGVFAEALRRAGLPDASLPFYERAATQARAAAQSESQTAPLAWADLAIAAGNWAYALRDVGDLDAARQRQLESAEARKKAGCSAVDFINGELEVLRIEVMQGKSMQALPQAEERLARVESWWSQHRAGQRVPEAPNPTFLARVLISALEIVTYAYFAQEDWESVLRRSDAMLEVKRALQHPAEEIALDRVNRANALRHLGRFGEAQVEFETCLQVFQHDPINRAKVLGSLANLFYEQGDVAQAITQGRRALALCEQLPNPCNRATLHNNLASYLEHNSAPSALAESQCHELAALIYQLVAGLGQDLQTSLHNYEVRFSRAHAAETPLAVPSVAELLADPAFRSLEDWLRQRRVDMDELQAAVNHYLELARQAALEQFTEQSP